ncbi:MAG: MarR family transcriptional regulator [Lentimicrobium sp.]|nr:MarR family transcriptional regulator [Lentimicrobium sp.]
MPTSIKQTVEQPLGRMLSMLGKGYLHLLRAKLQHLDIDRNYYALVLIESQDGTITQQELAGLLDSDKVSVVRVVDYLSLKGYVTRISQADDRRKHCLLLTDKAKQALPEIRKSINELNVMVLAGLGSQQVASLSLAIGKIKKNITEKSITP